MINKLNILSLKARMKAKIDKRRNELIRKRRPADPAPRYDKVFISE
jgi:hypothetical protein